MDATSAGSEPDFRALFEAAPGLYLVLTPDLRIVAVSEAYLRATMTRRESILGRGLFEVFPDNPDDPAASGVRNLKASLERVLAKRVPDTMAIQKYDIRRPDSEGGGFEERYWSPINTPVLNAAGGIDYIIHRVEDVTEFIRLRERGREQQKLVDASDLVRNLVESSDDAIITKNLAGIITSWNPGAERLFGLSAAEAVGQPMTILIPKERAEEEQEILTRIARGEVIDHFETVRVRKGGEEVDISATISPIKDARGRIIGASKIARDISARKRDEQHQAELHAALQNAYDELRQTQQAILQQERLGALGQMASGIAHDINNAISPVMLYTASLLEREPNLTPEGRRFLETIQHAIDDVAQTVSRMREFYRPRESQMTLAPVHLNRVVERVLDLTSARWHDLAHQRGIVIEVKTELASELPPIMGAESEIRDALTNLVFNAIDALPQGGTLTVRTETEGRSVRLEVSDTGTGMEEETRRRCLEPFFTTKGERGTGLGLAMVYGVVKRHSAEISIESALGMGTTVRLTFAAAREPQTSTASAPAAQGQSAALRLLLIDDDPLVLESLTDILSADGHSVTSAPGGGEGVEAFRTAHAGGEPFEAVITDLGMPHLDGRQVARAIRAIAPAVPVILLTGWAQKLASEGDIPSHVDCVLGKPPKLAELRRALAGIPLSAEKRG